MVESGGTAIKKLDIIQLLTVQRTNGQGNAGRNKVSFLLDVERNSRSSHKYL